MAIKYLVLMVLMFGPTAWAQYRASTTPHGLLCLLNGGPYAYERAMIASLRYRACLSNIFGSQEMKILTNFTVDDISNEMHKKYCPKIEKAVECWDDLIKGVNSCFNGEAKEKIRTIGKVIKQAAEFMCHDHAEIIKLFFAGGGPECYQRNKRDIDECDFVVKPNSNVLSALLRATSFGDNECDFYKKLEECIIDPMKTCKSSAPADLVQSLFKEAFKGTPCDKMSTRIIVLMAVVVLAMVVVTVWHVNNKNVVV